MRIAALVASNDQPPLQSPVWGLRSAILNIGADFDTRVAGLTPHFQVVQLKTITGKGMICPRQ